jgi:hypothetical protein
MTHAGGTGTSGDDDPAASARAFTTLDVRSCELYAPGHQMHYRHQGEAVRSPSRAVTSALLDDDLVILVLDDASEVRWRHHDRDRLRRALEALPGKHVVYPEHHALRVGPFWFNCAPEDGDWQDCRPVAG